MVAEHLWHLLTFLSLTFSFVLFCFWCFEFYKLFIYLEINPLSDVSLANIFSHSVSCPFILLTVFFAAQKHLSLM